MTKTVREPGTVRSGSTRTRPARSSGTPSVAPSGDAATPAAQMMVSAANDLGTDRDVPGRDAGHRGSSPHVDAEARQIGARGFAQGLGERGQHRRTRLDQEDARRARVDVPEIARERLARDLGERAGHLDAGRAAADHDKRQERLAPARIGFTLGTFERQQHAPPDVERVLERLEARRGRAPLVVPEVGVRRAARDDQIVVRQPLVIVAAHPRGSPAAGLIDRAHLGEQDLDVLLAPQDPADGRRDVAGRKRRHRHLVEQRLEDVMIPAVENRDADPRAAEGAGGIQPAKAAADDDDMGKSHVGGACSPWYCDCGGNGRLASRGRERTGRVGRRGRRDES